MNIALTPDGTASFDVNELVGSFRSFGVIGPVYEVTGLVPGRADVTLRVLETGEELTYAIAELLKDPVAR